jgi:hypothetical protein
LCSLRICHLLKPRYTFEKGELLDSSLQSILSDFVEESSAIVSEAEDLLDQIQDGELGPEAFGTVAGKVDGVMGCAKTLGLGSFPQLEAALVVVSNLSEGVKALGYKASQQKENEMTPIVAGFLQDALELLSKAVQDLKKGYVSVDTELAKTVSERLLWLTPKLKLSEEEQKKLLAKFGL